MAGGGGQIEQIESNVDQLYSNTNIRTTPPRLNTITFNNKLIHVNVYTCLIVIIIRAQTH